MRFRQMNFSGQILQSRRDNHSGFLNNLVVFLFSGVTMVALIFYITVAMTIVAVILSVIYWIKERKNRF
jgi:hypothetical protein